MDTQTLKIKTALRKIKEGKIECLTDLKIGYVEIRKSNGKIEIIEIIN